MSCGQVQVLQNPNIVSLKQCPTSIQIFQGVQMVKICSQTRTPVFAPYSFTATVNNQTSFGPLPASVLSIITLAITGTMQDPAGVTPDYTLSGLNIILSQGISIGNTVYGMLQVNG